MKKLFGTDGIRGLSNSYPIRPEECVKIGLIVGNYFINQPNSTKRVVVGKDTRLSSYMIENAITSGLLSAGMDVFLVGPMPTPAVGFLTRSMRCDVGIMISASHNLYQDNGIKFFDSNAEKFSCEMQEIIEKQYNKYDSSSLHCHYSDIGRAKRLDDTMGRYVEFIKRTFPAGESLNGMRVVIDTANGAGYSIASEILWELGAEIIAIGNQPNGTNINKGCGSTDLNLLQETVVNTRADIGIAIDGDGDRVLFVDEMGEEIHGDQIIATLAKEVQHKDKLKHNVVVATVMSNYGLEKHLEKYDIKVVRSDVGDRMVYQEMKKHDAQIGGEESGHIIFKKYSTTGDGILIAVQILSILKKSKQKASKVLYAFTPIPQIRKNIQYDIDFKEKIIGTIPVLQAEYSEKYKNKARILIRKSGTENVVRIMIECEDEQLSEKIIEEISLGLGC